MSKPKFDLSNVGGQPKDWMQKSHEAEVSSNGWANIWVPAALVGIPVLLLISAAAYLLSVLNFVGKFN